MPEGYPKLETMGGKQLFIFRFEKFSTSALYDPIVSLGKKSGDDDNTTTVAPELMKSMSYGDVTVDVIKKSGEMKVKTDDKTLSLMFDNLMESKSDETAIQTSGHQVSSFAEQEFTVSDAVDDMLQDLDVKKMTFSTTFGNGASMAVYLYLFKEGGNITNGDEKAMVYEGSVKFSVQITGWKFCGDTGVTCTNEVGTHLGFDIVVKGTGDPEHKASESVITYDFGDGDVLVFSEYTVDSTPTFLTMPEGYPQYDGSTAKKVLRAKFAKFDDSVVYDPIVEIDREKNGSAAITASMTSLFLLTLVHAIRKLEF